MNWLRFSQEPGGVVFIEESQIASVESVNVEKSRSRITVTSGAVFLVRETLADFWDMVRPAITREAAPAGEE